MSFSLHQYSRSNSITMKKITKFLLLGFISLAVITACSIEKRHYNSGYHVVWKNNHQSSDKNEMVENESKNSVSPENTIASVQPVLIQKEELTTEPNTENSNTIQNNESTTTSHSLTDHESQTLENKKSIAFDKKMNRLVGKSIIKAAKKSIPNSKDDTDEILLIILCFLLPPVAVGLKTNWDQRTVLINILLTLLCGIPGIIHALLVVLE